MFIITKGLNTAGKLITRGFGASGGTSTPFPVTQDTSVTLTDHAAGVTISPRQAGWVVLTASESGVILSE